jgi:hypothetical protein
MQTMRLLILLSSLFIAGVVSASPTSDDFKLCHSLSSEVLKGCLDSSAGYLQGNVCWQEAQSANRRCYLDVQNEYRVSSIKAEPDSSSVDLEVLLNDEITKLIELYSDGFADSDLTLRHITYGPLFDSDKPAAVVFFSLAGVGLSNIHHEYIAVFAQGGGLDLTRIKGPKEKAFHLVATALVGSKETRTLIWDTAQITQGTIVVKGLRWGKGDPGCCPSESIEVEFTISDNLVSELIPNRYPLLQEKIK